MPPLLSSAVEAQIDHYAASLTALAFARLVSLLPHALDDQIGHRYQIAFPTNFPPVGNVAWAVQVHGPSGITTDGAEVSTGGDNNRARMAPVSPSTRIGRGIERMPYFTARSACQYRPSYICGHSMWLSRVNLAILSSCMRSSGRG